MIIPLLYNQPGPRAAQGRTLARISQLAASGQIKPLLDPHVFPFEQAGAAHALLESGSAIGTGLGNPFGGNDWFSQAQKKK